MKGLFNTHKSIMRYTTLLKGRIKVNDYLNIHRKSIWQNSMYIHGKNSHRSLFRGNVCVYALVTQSCSTLCDPMDCRPPSFSVHGILQARILEWIAIPFFRGSSQPKDWTQISCIAGRLFTIWATRETLT